MRCRPAAWVWGFLPLAFIIALALYGVRGQVERDLNDRTSAVLKKAGYNWAFASLNGRDATLEGISFSGEERDTALRLVRAVWGVRAVVDNVRLIASPETYTWLASKKDHRIRMRGYVPTEEDRRTILGFVKAAMPDSEVDDRMALAGGSPPRQTWLGSVSFALAQLGRLAYGSVRLDGMGFTIDGVAATTEAYGGLKDTLADQLPGGVKLRFAKLRPPVVRPYNWRVKYTGSTISFDGYVSSEDVHEQIIERTRNLFPGVPIEDSMVLASGAPESWPWAVAATLSQLSRLESGRAKFKDAMLEFEGVAADEWSAKHVTSSIRNSLPESYSSNEKITVSKNAAPEKQGAN